MACDEWVLMRSDASTVDGYGEVLLMVSHLNASPRLGSPIHAGMAESKTGLVRRIRHLIRIRPHDWRATTVALAALAILLLLTGPAKSEPAKVSPTTQPPLSTPPAASSPKPRNALVVQVEIESKFSRKRSISRYSPPENSPPAFRSNPARPSCLVEWGVKISKWRKAPIMRSSRQRRKRSRVHSSYS